MQARTRNLLTLALAAALASPLAFAQHGGGQGHVGGTMGAPAMPATPAIPATPATPTTPAIPATPAVPATPTLPTNASDNAADAVSKRDARNTPPMDATDSQNMDSAVRTQMAPPTAQGADHAAANSEVVTRDVFNRLDSDGNGVISAAEAGADATFDGSFASMDSNHDGVVSTDEYRSSAKGAVSQGAEHAAGNSSVVIRDVFGRLDADGDGRISATEAGVDAGFSGNFSAADADGDGFVTDTEYRAYAKANKPGN